MEQKAQEYINKLYIDYGDLNEKAEEQIKQAFIDGMKEQLLIQRASNRRELFCECAEPKPMLKDMYDKTTCNTCRKEIEQSC